LADFGVHVHVGQFNFFLFNASIQDIDRFGSKNALDDIS
jgi:hypothetical protein